MAYELVNSYAGESLLSGFNWINYPDPSNGFVAYQNQEDALGKGLYSIDPDTNVVRLGVDSTNRYDLDEGRPSIRIESKESYEKGLFIADFLHMPPSECGVWPAFWAFGSDWPEGGELDIIEGANLAYTNIMSGHTADGCFLSPSDAGRFTGERRNLDCAIGDNNVGCGYNPPASDTSSYGDGFNAVGGGVYAVQWNNEFLSVWHFPRGSIPEDIDAKVPDPSGWGLPQAVFGGADCDVNEYYNNMNLVLNINFCGDYAGSTWNDFKTCNDKAPTCDEYVADNPDAFENVYWEVKYIDVYQFPSDNSFTIDDGGGFGIGGEPTATPTPMPNNGTAMTTPAAEPTTTTSEDGGFTISTPGNEPSATPSRSSSRIPSSIPSSTSSSTSTGTSISIASASNPDRIGSYSYLGCFGSTSGFTTFALTEEDTEMTLELCVDSCNGITYAGVFEGKCYCADSLDSGTRAVADATECDHLCPGNEDEFCGGLTDDIPGTKGFSNSTTRRWFNRRNAPSNYLLTVYGDVSAAEPDVPPPMRPSVTVSVVSVAGVTSTQFVDITTTITYTIPCPTNMASLMEQQFVATLQDCGCDSQSSVPMETKVVQCQACGPEGQNEVTVTVPVTENAASAKNFVVGAPTAPFLSVAQEKIPNQTTSQWTPASTPAKDIPLVATSGSRWNEPKTSIALTSVVVAVLAILA